MTNIDKEVALELTLQNKELREEIYRLRALLWIHHGCTSELLYGDDGELQCHNNSHDILGIDFRRDSIDLIEWKLSNQFGKSITPRPKN